jgi:hypothetical protein
MLPTKFRLIHVNKNSQYMNGPSDLPSPPQGHRMSQQQQYYDATSPVHPQAHPSHLQLQQQQHRGSRSSSMISPARPSQAPPPPPPFDPNMERLKGQRDSLPPPPFIYCEFLFTCA